MKNYRFKNIIPYSLFEVADPKEPLKYNTTYFTSNETKRGIEIAFETENEKYTMFMSQIDCGVISYYVSFSTYNITNDIFSGKYAHLDFSEQEYIYSKETNMNEPFSIIPNLVWLLKHFCVQDNVGYISFVSTSDKKMRIFEKIVGYHTEYVKDFTDPIALYNTIKLFKLK
jgi:hypothetical protein